MSLNQTFCKVLEIEGRQSKLKSVVTNQKTNLKLNPAQGNIKCASLKNSKL